MAPRDAELLQPDGLRELRALRALRLSRRLLRGHRLGRHRLREFWPRGRRLWIRRLERRLSRHRLPGSAMRERRLSIRRRECCYEQRVYRLWIRRLRCAKQPHYEPLELRCAPERHYVTPPRYELPEHCGPLPERHVRRL